MDLDWITMNEPADIYHEQSKSGKYMSSHLLKDFNKSPQLYYRKVHGLVEEKKSDALLFGSAAHKLVLEGFEAFSEEYVVSDGPINEKTGKPFGPTTNAYLAWAASQDREIISTKDFGKCRELETSVLLNDRAKTLLHDGVAEGVVRADLGGVPCQIRMDWFNPDYGIVDYKTTADLDFFNYDIKRLGYLFQMAFYRAVVEQATGEVMPVYLIATEKEEPKSTGVWKIPAEFLDRNLVFVLKALEKYKNCRQTGVWPTGYEEVRVYEE